MCAIVMGCVDKHKTQKTRGKEIQYPDSVNRGLPQNYLSMTELHCAHTHPLSNTGIALYPRLPCIIPREFNLDQNQLKDTKKT